MPKPSIFSENYDKQMNRRKKRKIVLILIIVVVLILTISFKSNIKKGINGKVDIVFNKLKGLKGKTNKNKINKKKNDVSSEKSKKDKLDNNKEENKDNKDNIKKNNSLKTENYEIILSNGQNIKLSYNLINNEKKYTKVEPSNISYSISPSGKYVVISESSTQNLILVDINANKKDITKKQYVSSKGQVFNKDNILKSNSNYIWCISPKFLDEDNIVYISQLPWFNRMNQKFIWKYTISLENHQCNISSSKREISGSDIKYGNVTPEGLEVIIDGVKNIVK